MPEFIAFSFSNLHAELLIPMAISLVGGIVILFISAFVKSGCKNLSILLAILFVVLNLGFLLGVLENSAKTLGFFNLLLVDGISLVTQIIILLSALLLLPLFIDNHILPEVQRAEFYALMLFSIAGFGFMVSSENLILILLGLECASLSIYAMIALGNRPSCFESSIKYFTMGAFATAIYAFGAMLLYLASGSLDINVIKDVLALADSNGALLLMLSGFVFMLSALGFKLSIVPFHTWGPDVYEGSNSLLAAFVSIAPKIATFAVVLRIFSIFVESNNSFVYYTLYTLVILTMSVPNIIALAQKDVKRMLAYSSISHSGFVLAGVLMATSQAHSLMFFYWFLFLFTNIGAFAILWLIGDDEHSIHARFSHPYEKFSGMIKSAPTLSIFLAIFMVSLAGIPPLAVFWGKAYMMAEALHLSMFVLAIAMALNSIIAAFYYFKVIVYMFAKEPDSKTIHDDLALPLPTKAILTIVMLVSVGALLLAQKLLTIFSQYINI